MSNMSNWQIFFSWTARCTVAIVPIMVFATLEPSLGSTTSNFTFQGQSAYVKIPDAPRADRPWVWRSRWPNFYTAHETILVEEHGFHVAYEAVINATI
jgi:hypothetical protein